MPTVREQTESSGRGWEDAVVMFDSVADGLMKNGEMRVIYKAGDRTFSLGVDPEDPHGKLVGFVVGDAPTGEAALRQHIIANAIRDPLPVKANDNFIQHRTCPLGPNDTDKDYEGKLAFIYTGTRTDFNDPSAQQDRVSLALYTDEGERVTMNDPTPVLKIQVGRTGKEDIIDGELNRSKAFWAHVCACGLNWTRFIEDMNNAEALWPRKMAGPDEVVNSFFSSTDPAEWPKDIMRVIQNHGGPLRVKWTMTKHERGYATPKRNANKIYILETVAQQVSAEDQDWLEWRAKFADVMDVLVGQAFGNSELTFVDRATWFLTEKGKEVAVHSIKPVYQRWDNVAPPQGITTRIASPDNWSTDLFIAFHHVADSLLKTQQTEYELAVTGLVGEGRADALLAWLDANPEAKHYLEFGEEKL